MKKCVYKLFPYSPNANGSPSIFRLPEGENIENYSDCVLMSNFAYREIFGETKSKTSTDTKLLSVVKISFNGECIHRRYRYINTMPKDCLALTCDSLKILESDITKIKEVNVSKGCCIKYFWHTHTMRPALQ